MFTCCGAVAVSRKYLLSAAAASSQPFRSIVQQQQRVPTVQSCHISQAEASTLQDGSPIVLVQGLPGGDVLVTTEKKEKAKKELMKKVFDEHRDTYMKLKDQ